MLRGLFRMLDPPADPRICRMIFDEICVLANGDIVCSCGDPAGKRVYGNVLRDRVGAIFDGPGYRDMRRWQLEAPPSSWCPVIGSECGGRVSRPTTADRLEARGIRMLQLEPISHCNLACPACPVTHFALDPAYRPDRAAVLPLETMIDVVDQLPDLEKILFYNFGEPFLHPRALDFLRAVRRCRPEIVLHTSTNGLALTPAKIEAIAAEALLDRIVFSIDGAREESYQRYRVGGEQGRAVSALAALANACRRHGTASRVEILWQYILFRWNDSDQELAEARARATEIGVPLRFVVTHTEGASARFRPGQPELSEALGADDPWSLLTCDLRRANLDGHAGIAQGRFLARLRARPDRLTTTPGGRVALWIEIENPTPWRWNVGGSRHRLGVQLRTGRGRLLRELPAPALDGPPIGAQARGTRILDLLAPVDPGDYELLIDIVEEGVAWFHERGSAPAILPLRVDPDAPLVCHEAALPTRLFEAVLGRSPARDELEVLRAAIASGRTIEAVIRDLADFAPDRERPRAIDRGRLVASRALGLDRFRFG